VHEFKGSAQGWEVQGWGVLQIPIKKSGSNLLVLASTKHV